MSTSSLRTQVRRLAQELIPPGELVIVLVHECEAEVSAKARGLAALGRPWRAGDMLVLISQQGPCSSSPHAHQEPVIISPRKD